MVNPNERPMAIIRGNVTPTASTGPAAVKPVITRLKYPMIVARV
jgi:hypothetical protein